MNDGGPAFPRPAFYPDDPCDRMDHELRLAWSHERQDGMSLRDYFAGQALAGLLSGKWVGQGDEDEAIVYAGELNNPPSLTAGMAYRLADAMIAAREKSP